METIEVIAKIVVTYVLMVPAVILTAVIWTLGGWTRGFDYMPNPLYRLIDWGLDF